ncbi:MAG: winged helix-turn-helix domain-containing protein [Anaerolineales bacterium]|nr:winged helix-turn-helix domain-containing protein [Anaerolineales bacterium]
MRKTNPTGCGNSGLWEICLKFASTRRDRPRFPHKRGPEGARSAARQRRKRGENRFHTLAIGETAGEVWRFLKDHGKSPLTAVEKGVKAPAIKAPMAVGRLVREGKLGVAQEIRSIYLWLTAS